METNEDAVEMHPEPLMKLFGQQERTQLINTFLVHETDEFTVEELSQQTGVDRSTVRDQLDALEEMAIVGQTETENSNRYWLNGHSSIVTYLQKLEIITQTEQLQGTSLSRSQPE